MILIGLGGNIDGPWGSPRETMREAVRRIGCDGIVVEQSSALIETAPLGGMDQPNFLNAVARVTTDLDPQELLSRLETIEHAAGRRREKRWGPRTLDLDLLDHDGLSIATDRLILPHPEIANRPFVLIPISRIAPFWRHPVSGESADELLARLSTAVEGRVLAETAW